LATPEEIRPDRPATIRRMFETLAPDYDRLNGLLTFGLVGGWRRALVAAARIEPGQRVLDVACGTGRSLAEARSAVGRGGMAVGVDFTEGMLRRASGHRVLGDGLILPFPDGAFDATISAFALRDVSDQERFLSEMARVARPGGRVSLLEIGRPLRQPLRLGFDLWFRGAVPRIAALAGQAESHRFLVRSLSFLPAPAALVRMMERAGTERVAWRDLSLGAARVFSGVCQMR
jgi:demethylmenaquinone methyltransferase/2-methoxy-6-polyprenyl-1,4-benzoquinol methylase